MFSPFNYFSLVYYISLVLSLYLITFCEFTPVCITVIIFWIRVIFNELSKLVIFACIRFNPPSDSLFVYFVSLFVPHKIDTYVLYLLSESCIRWLERDINICAIFERIKLFHDVTLPRAVLLRLRHSCIIFSINIICCYVFHF